LTIDCANQPHEGVDLLRNSRPVWNEVLLQTSAKAPESDLQTKLNFTGRSEREHAGPHADAIRIVCRRIRAIDGTGGASKEAGHNARRQVEVGKVVQVVEPD